MTWIQLLTCLITHNYELNELKMHVFRIVLLRNARTQKRYNCRNPIRCGPLYFTNFVSLKLHGCTFSVHGAAATGAHKCAQER